MRSAQEFPGTRSLSQVSGSSVLSNVFRFETIASGPPSQLPFKFILTRMRLGVPLSSCHCTRLGELERRTHWQPAGPAGPRRPAGGPLALRPPGRPGALFLLPQAGGSSAGSAVRIDRCRRLLRVTAPGPSPSGSRPGRAGGPGRGQWARDAAWGLASDSEPGVTFASAGGESAGNRPPSR